MAVAALARSHRTASPPKARQAFSDPRQRAAKRAQRATPRVRPDIRVFDVRHRPQATPPGVDVGAAFAISGIRSVPVAFSAEVPLACCVFLVNRFTSQAALSAFLSMAVIAAVGRLGGPPKQPARSYELLALVKAQTVMPAALLRKLCEAFPDATTLALVVGNAITVAVEAEQLAAKGGAPC